MAFVFVLVILGCICLAALASPEIDALWNFSDPAGSAAKFLSACDDHPESRDELLTQAARAKGLDGKFEEGWALLAQISPEASPKVKMRRELEAGRLTNSSGDPEGARPFFHRALEQAQAIGEDGYAVDAAHMIAIVVKDQEAIDWNLKAIEMARASSDERAQKWRGSLLNNLGWTLHDLGRHAEALALFEEALEFRIQQGAAENIQIARWSVARCLRSLGRLKEALAIQQSLEGETTDPYVQEELGELYEALGDGERAKGCFARAYEGLSQDAWFVQNEAARLEGLRARSE